MPNDIETVAHAIQLAVAPVFLLAGIGAFLNVLSVRLSRAVDRSRVLQDRVAALEVRQAEELHEELAVLGKRIRIVNVAIMLCVLCSLFVCTVVAVIFLASVIDIAIAALIVWSFVCGMACLIIALLCLLGEIYLATMKMPIRR